MPVIVIGADTPPGRSILEGLVGRAGEVRAFVSDADEAARLKARGIKVALGDVSDASHVGGAALNAFTAVFVSPAASDARERSFAREPRAVFAAWAEAVADARVQRVIWIGSEDEAPQRMRSAPSGFRAVAPEEPDLATAVANLDSAAEI